MVKLCATQEQLDKEVSSAGDKLVVIDFFAEWCAPCRAIAPKLEQWAVSFEGEAVFLRVDVEENAAAAARFDVQKMPTFVLLKGGKVVAVVAGADPPKLLFRIRAALGATTRVPHA